MDVIRHLSSKLEVMVRFGCLYDGGDRDDDDDADDGMDWYDEGVWVDSGEKKVVLIVLCFYLNRQITFQIFASRCGHIQIYCRRSC